MIPEPNLWADLRERDRGLDEVEYPPHHLEVAAGNTRTLTLPRNGGNREHFLKEELELEPGLHTGSSATVTVSSAASMNNVNGLDAEAMRQRQRWTRRWYLLVIVLLYIGLLASFSLNVSLLLRKPTASAVTSRSSTTSEAAVSKSVATIGHDGKLTLVADSQGKNRKFWTTLKSKASSTLS